MQSFAYQAAPSAYQSAAAQSHRVSVPSVTVQVIDHNLNQLSREFSYQSVKDATSGFDKNNVLGTGSFGSVHRGTLPDGTQVAIKVIGNPQISGFENEVKILSKFRHPNLVMLLGFGRNGTERLLVYECMGRGDCERILKDRVIAPEFTWERRLSVLLDACRGLTYLMTSQPIAFHRDIKPSNILVNDEWVGKMADFGLACELPSLDMTSIKVPTSAGTLGYACPVYVQTGTVSEASEIYSFGICILEFLTGQPPTLSNPMFPGQVVHLIEKINGNLSSLVSLADKRVGWPDHVAQVLGRIVIECCNKPVNQRPGFLDVVKELNTLYTKCAMVKPLVGNEPPSLKPASPLVAPLPLSSFNQFQAAMNETASGNKQEIPRAHLAPVREESMKSSKTPYLEMKSISNPKDVRVFHFSQLECDQNIQPDTGVVIGRNRQTDIFSDLLQSDTLRLCVSRDHFEIRRDITGRFLLVNLSGNGTLVEGRGFLERKNESVEIRDGDVIKLVQTAINGSQSPFIEMKFHCGEEAGVSGVINYTVSVRNLETNANEKFDFVLAGNTSNLVQVIGRNTGGGMFSRLLRSQDRYLQLIDTSHFAVVCDKNPRIVSLRPLSDKGIIVGSDFVNVGQEKIAEVGSVDVFIPGIPHLVLTIAASDPACNRKLFDNARLVPEQNNIGRTMIGVPTILPTTRNQRPGAYPLLIR